MNEESLERWSFEHIYEYYENEFLHTIKFIVRPRWLSIILLVLRFAYEILLLVSKDTIARMATTDTNFAKLEQFAIFDEMKSDEAYLLAAIALNGLLVIMVPIFYILQSYNVRNIEVPLCLHSFIALVYNYALFIPSLLVSLSRIHESTAIAVLNVLLTIIIGFIICLHDSDFSQLPRDFLGKKRDTFTKVIVLIAHASQVGVYTLIDSVYASACIGVCICAFRVFTFHIYRNREMSQLNLFCTIALIWVSLLTLSLEALVVSLFPLSLCVFVTFSMSYKISAELIKFYYNIERQYSQYTRQFTVHPDTQDLFYRTLLDSMQIEFERYRVADVSLVQEDITVNHIKQCVMHPACFCNLKEEENDGSNGKMSLMSGRLRRMYLLDFILQGYQKCVHTMTKKKATLRIPVVFSYLTFLYEIQRSKLLFYVETIRLVQTLTLGRRDRAFSNEIEQHANQMFAKILVSQSRANQVDYSQTMSSADRREKNIKDRFIQQTDIKEAIVFDEKLMRAEKRYFSLLEAKEKIMVFLSSDMINLSVFREKCEKYQKERNILLGMLQELNAINSKSHRLDALLVGFSENLSFAVPKKHLFDQATFIKKRNRMERKRKGAKQGEAFKLKEDRVDTKLLNQVNLFSKKSCVVFITLIEKVGTIRKAQNSIQGLFGYSVREVIGKDISILMPRYVGDHHNAIISDYFNKPFISKTEGHSSFPFLIARSKRGWIVPVSIHFKADAIAKEDCGLVAFIEKMPSVNTFIMAKEGGDLLVESVSKEIYDRLFREFISPQDVNRIYMIRVIPLLRFLVQISFQLNAVANAAAAVEDDELAGTQVKRQLNFLETIAFLPKTGSTAGRSKSKIKGLFFLQKMKFEDMIWNLQNIDIQEYQLYRVQVKLQTLQNRHICYHVIEIQSLLKVRSYTAIREAFMLLQVQIEDFLNMKVSFEKQLKAAESLRQALITSRAKLGESERKIRKKNRNRQSTYNHSEFSQHTAAMIMMESGTSIHKHNKEDSIMFGSRHLINTENSGGIAAGIASHRFEEQVQYNNNNNNHFISTNANHLFNHSISQVNQTPFSMDISRNSRNPVNEVENSPSFQSSQKLIKMMNFSQRVVYENIHSEVASTFDQQQQQLLMQQDEIDHRDLVQVLSDNRNLSNSSYVLGSGKLGILSPTSQPLLIEQPLSTVATATAAAAGQQARRSAFSSLSVKIIPQPNQQFQHQQSNNNSPTDDASGTPSERFLRFQNPPTSLRMIPMSNNIAQQATDIDEASSNAEIPMKSMHFFQAAAAQDKMRASNSNNLEIREGNLGDEDDEEDDDEDDIDDEGEGTQNDEKNSNTQVPSVSVGVPQNHQHSMQLGGQTIDQTSTKYGSSMTQTSRMNVRRTILTQKSNQALKTLKYFGIFSLICIVSITLFVYLEMLYQIDIAYVTFQYIPWPIMFRCNYSISSHYQALVQTVKRKIFDNDELDSTYLAAINERVDLAVEGISELYLKYVHGDHDKLQFFSDFTKTPVKMVFNRDLNTVSGSKLVNNATYKWNVPMSMAYMLQTSVGYIYRYSKVEDNLYEQVVRLDNVAGLISNITSLDQKIYDQCDTILTTISDQAFLLMDVVILMTFLLISSVFPLYWYVQRKNESILKLFATIKQDHLDEMIRPLNFILEQARKQQRISLPDHCHFSRFPKKKKKYSQTTKLLKFKMHLLIYSIFFFASIIIQPIVNYISIINLSDEVKKNIVLTRTIFDMRAQEVSTNSQNYQYLLYRMDSSYNLYNLAYYQKRIPNLITQNNEKLSNMTIVLNQSKESTNRYKQSKFDTFFYKIFEGNLCEAMRDFPEYIQTENQIDYDWCVRVREGKFLQGFMLAFKDYLTEFQRVSDMFNITDNTQFRATAREWEAKVNFHDFDDFTAILYRSLNIVKDFMITMMSDQLMYNQSLQSVLFAYQCVTLGIIFYFGWIKFYSAITVEMYDIRKLLSIIDIQIVLESQHIINFLNH